MSYNVHNFKTGETIEAGPVNEMDQQIQTNESNIATKAPKASPVFTGSISMGRKANTTVGYNSTTAGGSNEASGPYSSAFGFYNTASGDESMASGHGTIAVGRFQNVFGRYNKEDIFPTWTANTHYNIGDKVTRWEHTEFGDLEWHLRCITENTDSSFVSAHWQQLDPIINADYVEIVGNGTADNARSNARTLDWDGNEYLAGSITLGKGTTDEVTLTAAQLKQLLALLT